LKILFNTHCIDTKNTSSTQLKYVDVDILSWQAKVIKKADDLNIINGSVNGNNQAVFKPNEPITKIEALKIILNLSDITLEKTLNTNYLDVQTGWHNKYVAISESL
jgi:hypothetical protein